MKKNKTYIILITLAISIIFLYFIASSAFTEITFPNEFETDDKEAYLSFLETEKYNCKNQKDLEVIFRYKFPFVNFKGKVDITLHEDEKKRVIYSGIYKDKIKIKKICVDSLKGELGLIFTRKKDGARCSFNYYNDIRLHRDKKRLEFYITNFNVGRNDFEILD
ncbi:hypothetical protein [Tenacibaculum ovolyticum]|uniref:hypothetical protein n=1 Tax=Tenacibaculum ovolyticum TaxID=104270 RepID=UPI000415A1F8|nr:hypothetical protein [Tenacibaculum ovolyticum]